MGDAELEGAADDGAVLIRGRVAAEVLPQANRKRWEKESAAAASSIDHAREIIPDPGPAAG